MFEIPSLDELVKEATVRGHIIQQIIELHAPELIFGDVYCSHCLETVNYETDQAPYPCATIQIIEKHLGEPQ